jgi:hypothetical protein
MPPRPLATFVPPHVFSLEPGVSSVCLLAETFAWHFNGRVVRFRHLSPHRLVENG